MRAGKAVGDKRTEEDRGSNSQQITVRPREANINTSTPRQLCFSPLLVRLACCNLSVPVCFTPRFWKKDSKKKKKKEQKRRRRKKGTWEKRPPKNVALFVLSMEYIIRTYVFRTKCCRIGCKEKRSYTLYICETLSFDVLNAGLFLLTYVSQFPFYGMSISPSLWIILFLLHFVY